MKTAELTGAALDWVVAKCEGWKDWEADDEAFTWAPDGCGWLSLESYKPSTDWAYGGPIIEREKICIAWLSKQDLGSEPEHYCVAHIDGVYCRYGQTPLIAAMRCYVASTLGDEVDVPEELLP